MTFEPVIGEVGDKGANGIPTAVPGLQSINFVGAAGGAAPAGAVTGDAVVDTLGVVFRTTSAGTLEVASGTAPLQAVTGAKGPPGGWADHPHALTYDAPRTYQEYFDRSIWPGFPEPAAISGGQVTNVPGVAAQIIVELGQPTAVGRVSTGAAYDPPEQVTAQRAVRAALPAEEQAGEPLVAATNIRKVCVKVYGTTAPVPPSNPDGLGEEGPWLTHPNQVGATCVLLVAPPKPIQNTYEMHIPPISTAAADYTGFLGFYPAYEDVLLRPRLPRSEPIRLQIPGPRARDPITPEAWLPAHFYVAAFVWDNYGNGPVGFVQREAGAGAWGTRNLMELTQVLKDITPPGKPVIQSVVFNEAARTWTITVKCPADTDLKTLSIGYAVGTQTPPSKPTSVTLPATPGQVVTWTTPQVPVNTTPPAGHIWTSAPNRHAVEIGVVAEAEDLEGNISDKAVQGGRVNGGQSAPPVPPRPPPINNVLTGFDGGRSVTYSYSGSQVRSMASSKWEILTGNYGGYYGNQWSAVYLDLRRYAGYRVTSMTLSWFTVHTWFGSGATHFVGHHWYDGLPPTMPPGSFAEGSVGSLHVARNSWSSIGVPLHVAQALVDGQAFGFVFGGPGNNSQGAYSRIQFDSSRVTFNLA